MNLTQLTPDAARSDATRARCHQRLARQRDARAPKMRPLTLGEGLFVGGFCTAYMAAVLFDAISVLIR
jgi:hypothetical protein